MPDRENVVNALEEVIAEAVYPDRPRKFMMPLELAEDTLALLKAQEPVEPVEEKRRGGYFRCGNCNARVSKVFEDKYCSQCGRPVKWE